MSPHLSKGYWQLMNTDGKESFFFHGVACGGCPCSREWPCTHVHTTSTNWIQELIHEVGRRMWVVPGGAEGKHGVGYDLTH